MNDVETRLIKINPDDINSELIATAASLLQADELVAFPTETVYGLGGNAKSESAVKKIYEAKGRPSTDPLIVHIGSVNQLSEVAINVPQLAEQLIQRFWPGPLTLLLQRSDEISPAVSAGMPTVAVRMPSHPIALALLKAANLPIAAPSANLFSHTSPTTAQHVLDDLNGRIPMIVDGGPTTVGVESTIVDISGNAPRILRPGGISVDELRDIIPDIEVITRTIRSEQEVSSAPGMLLKHYSPRAEMLLIEGSDEAIRRTIAAMAGTLKIQGKQVGILATDEDRAALEDGASTFFSLGSLHELDEVARNLFAGMRDLDSRGVDCIIARSYPADGIGLALRDRLMRAAEGKVIQAT